MTSRLFAICFRTTRPEELARFWSRMLGRESTHGGPDGDVTLLPPHPGGFHIRFLPGRLPKTGHNRAHFDLTSSSPQEQQHTVARAVEHGGTHIDVGQLPQDGHVVLADPDGNEFCVIEADNAFLADTAFLGAVACAGTQEVGYFWSETLRWPLVWDQEQETAIQSPDGGTKITWGGPPVPPKTGANRLHFQLEPTGDADRKAEADRLVSLGATRTTPDDGTQVLLLDPDGNEFALRAPETQ